MYGNSLSSPAECVAKDASLSSRNTTISQNIDNRIQHFQEQIERLQTVKAKLAGGSLLDVSLDDLQLAMGRY